MLTWNFNRLLAAARQDNADYFLLIHDDVLPEKHAIDMMLDILEQHKLGVLSVALPIRQYPRDASTAIYSASVHRRLPLKEIQGVVTCPPTDGLRINTGLMMMDLHTPARDIVFGVGNYIDPVTGNVSVYSEDWLMSHQLEEWKVPYGTTTDIRAWHEADLMLSNEPYGAEVRVDGCESDNRSTEA